jgi:hypothetical protein
MLTIELLIKGKPVITRVPSNWDECSPKQAEAYFTYVYPNFNEIFEYGESGLPKIKNFEEYRSAANILLFHLLNIGKSKFWRISKVERDRLIFDEKLIDFFFTSKYMNNLAWKVKPGMFSKRLFGPRNNFEQVTYEEFGFAQNYYKAHYLGEKSALDLFCAIFFRPAKPDYNPESPHTDGDIREPFNRYNVEKRVKQVENIPLWVKFSLLTWFDDCLNALAMANPECFTKKTEVHNNSTFSFYDLALSLGDGNKGASEILKENVKLVFKDLHRRTVANKAD